MYKIVCVTNRNICKEDFLTRIESVAACKPSSIILREKDLTEAEYTSLAREIMPACARYDVEFVIHSFVGAAMSTGARSIHLPLDTLREMSADMRGYFVHLGCSCHSAGDVREALELGADRIVAGHIFDTDCKRGLPGRGLGFLSEMCSISSAPVYAIGGISPENIHEVINAGAAGACIMSGLMTCQTPAEYMKKLRGEI